MELLEILFGPDEDNHANQLNPNNDEYYHSREAGSCGNDDDDDW